MSKTETRVAPITVKAPPTWIQKALDGEQSTGNNATTIKMGVIPPALFSENFLSYPVAEISLSDSLNATQIAEIRHEKGKDIRGFSAIKKLNLQTIEEIRKIGCKFDPHTNSFYFEDGVCHKRTAEELNQASRAMDLFSDIDFSEIMALCNVLYDDPYFAAYTDIGIKIFKIIRDWPISMTFDEKFYYRARIVDDEFAMPLAHEMMKPPEDIPSQGRFNEYGRSRFYFTNSPDGAIKEILGHSTPKDKFVQVVKLEPVDSVRLIDLSKATDTRNCFITALRKSVVDENAKVKKEYLLPNYVAGCCRAAGLDGIKYRGNGYSRYVTWTDAKLNIVDYERPIKVSELIQNKD